MCIYMCIYVCILVQEINSLIMQFNLVLHVFFKTQFHNCSILKIDLQNSPVYILILEICKQIMKTVFLHYMVNLLN